MFSSNKATNCSGWENSSSYCPSYVLHIIIDAWSRVPAMLLSSNTQSFQRTVMVRDRHWPVFISTTSRLFCIKLEHSSPSLFFSKARVRQHGLVVWTLLTTSWSALGRLQCQSLITPLVTWLSCPPTLWWLRPESRDAVVTTLLDQQVSDVLFIF